MLSGGDRELRGEENGMRSFKIQDVAATMQRSDPWNKDQPKPEIDPPKHPVPGTPQPGDPPKGPPPVHDPPPSKPVPGSPEPMKPQG